MTKIQKELIIFFIPILVLYGIILLRTAWVCDDAYITLRTVDNFIHGYGLTWNPGERVQTNVHPLWMFVLSAVIFITREHYLTLIFLSMGLSLLAVSLLAFKISLSRWASLLGLTALLFSKSFIDYSTSGLENPLSYVIVVAFALLYFSPETSSKKLLGLAWLACLGILTRLDAALLFIPPLVHSF